MTRLKFPMFVLSGTKVKMSNLIRMTSMTIEELSHKLKKLGVQDDDYYLHGLYGSTDDSDKIALTMRKGEYSVEYEVYYRERGEKHSSRTFTTKMTLVIMFYHKFKNSAANSIYALKLKFHMFVEVA